MNKQASIKKSPSLSSIYICDCPICKLKIEDINQEVTCYMLKLLYTHINSNKKENEEKFENLNYEISELKKKIVRNDIKNKNTLDITESIKKNLLEIDNINKNYKTLETIISNNSSNNMIIEERLSVIENKSKQQINDIIKKNNLKISELESKLLKYDELNKKINNLFHKYDVIISSIERLNNVEIKLENYDFLSDKLDLNKIQYDSKLEILNKNVANLIEKIDELSINYNKLIEQSNVQVGALKFFTDKYEQLDSKYNMLLEISNIQSNKFTELSNIYLLVELLRSEQQVMSERLNKGETVLRIIDAKISNDK